MTTAEYLARLIRRALASPACEDPMEAYLYLGPDTPRRAQIAREILAKSAKDVSKLVRVERTINRKGKSYITHLWVSPAKVKKTDTVTGNKEFYASWKKQNGEGTEVQAGKDAKKDGGKSDKASAPKVNPLEKLAKKQQKAKPKVTAKTKPEADDGTSEKSAPSKPTPEKSKPEKSTPKKATPDKPKPAKSKPEKPAPKKATPDKPKPEKPAPKATPAKTKPEKETPEKSTPEKPTPDSKPQKKTTAKPKPESKDKPDAGAKPAAKKTSAKPAAKKTAGTGGKKASVKKSDPEPKKTTISDEQFEKYMQLMTQTEVQGLIDKGKLTLTKAQAERFENWKKQAERFRDKRFPASFRGVMERRFEQAPPEAQKAFDRYVGKVSDCVGSTTTKRAYYSLDTGKVYFSTAEDSDNAVYGIPEGTTFLHELGHLIDHRVSVERGEAENCRSHDPDFIEALRADVQAAEQAMKAELKKRGEKTGITDVRKAVTREIQKSGPYSTTGIQDIFGGVIQRKYSASATGWHASSYWKHDTKWSKGSTWDQERVLGTEAFAHMFAACSDKGQDAAMEKWFPTAYPRFKEILKDIAQE